MSRRSEQQTVRRDDVLTGQTGRRRRRGGFGLAGRCVDWPTASFMTTETSPTGSPAHDASDELVLRVRKLLDKAERTDNVHEAEAFARKAAALVAEHRIDTARIEAIRAGRGDTTDVQLDIVEVNVGRGAYARGRLSLLTGLAASHDVRVVFRAMPEGTIAYAAGHADDLRLVEMMYHSLHQQASSHMATIKRNSGAATQQFRRSFLFGFAERISQIVAESRRLAEAVTVDPSNGDASAAATALALRERSERVDAFVADEWGRVRSAARPSPVQTAGYVRGIAAAERADIGRTRIGGRRSLGRGH